MKYRVFGLAFVVAMICAACSDDTGTLGVYSDSDVLTTIPVTYQFTTRSLPLDSAVSSKSKCYLGRLRDAETGLDMRAEFLAQYHVFENFTLPDVTTITSRDDEGIVCDSIDLRLYFTNYYGADTNPMKVAVYELDTQNPIREDSVYSTNVDLASYVNPLRPEPLVEKFFTVSDYTLTDYDRTNTSRYTNVRITLPREYGTQLLRAIAQNPEYCRDSYQFIRHLLPGFYFRLVSGVGTILVVDVSTIELHYRYTINGTEYPALTRFSATPEVLQTTRVVTGGVDALAPLDPVTKQPVAPTASTTYVAGPAGIATEITLPVDDIFEGHETDSIARARLSLNRYNPTQTSALSTPGALLMVPKDERYTFFRDSQLPDDITSYTATYSTDNTYPFSNIGRLLSTLYRRKQAAMAREGLTSGQYDAAYPDWNRVVVIPVSQTTNTSGNVVAVTPDFTFSCTALIGGTTPQDMQVIFTRH